MTDYMADSVYVGRQYCPGCEPEANPIAEVLEVRWCDGHNPMRSGEEDEKVQAAAYLSGSGEVGGEDNAQWCKLFHRGKRAC